MKITEITLLKSAMAELTEDIVVVAAYLYHSHKDDKQNSQYHYEVRVMKKSDVENEIQNLRLDKNRLTPYHWPTIPQYEVLIDKDANCGKVASWLNMKMKKLMSYDEFLKYLSGVKKFGKTEKINPHAVFPTEGYTCVGYPTQVSLKDKDTLISLCGKDLSLIKYPKRVEKNII